MISACALGTIRFPATPPGLGPVTRPELETWLRRNTTVVGGHQEMRFSWTFTDGKKENASATGNGKVRIAAPDSLRLDFAGPLATGRSAAFILGDSAIWAEPRDRVDQLVPEYSLLWALLGVARAPEVGALVLGASSTGTTAWQYISGTDTIRYVVSEAGPRQLSLMVHRSGKEVGRVLTTFNAAGALEKAVLLVTSEKAKLELKFTRIIVPADFDLEVWRAPSDSL